MEAPRYSSYTDPHNCEGITKAHSEAFNSLLERLDKATQHVNQQPPQQGQAFGSRTHRMYPSLGGWSLGR